MRNCNWTTSRISGKPIMPELRSLTTLLWIGPRSGNEFAQAYRYCETAASQIAWRSDLLQAVERPAMNVGQIVFARLDRSDVCQSDLDHLSTRHPEADWLALEGSSCAGATWRSPSRTTARYTHALNWDQVLPEFLNPQRGLELGLSNHLQRGSLAIIASNYENAAALMDLATETEVTAVWLNSPNSSRVRNVSVVWWDDSVTSDTSRNAWRTRVNCFGGTFCGEQVSHVWLTNSKCFADMAAATSQGISLVLSKPYRIEPLTATLNSLGQNSELPIKRLAA